MANVVDCTDPRGFRVTLSDERYRSHIRAKHWDVTPADIERVIKAPTVITYRPGDPEKNLYYLKGRWGGDRRLSIMKVVVGLMNEPAVVVTAYPFGNIDDEEEIIWEAD